MSYKEIEKLDWTFSSSNAEDDRKMAQCFMAFEEKMNEIIEALNAEKALPFEECKECIEVSKAIGRKVAEKAEPIFMKVIRENREKAERCPEEKIYHLEIGKTYKRIDGKPFPFNEPVGIYIGLTSGKDIPANCGMPRFKLSGARECFINAIPSTENFVEVGTGKLSTSGEGEDEIAEIINQEPLPIEGKKWEWAKKLAHAIMEETKK